MLAPLPSCPLHLAAEAQPLTGLSNAAFAEMARYEDVLRRSQARLNASSPCSPIAGVGGVRLSGEPELDLWDEDVDEEEDDEDEEEEEDVETKREAEASALKGRRRRGAAKPRATSSGGARSGGGRSRRPVGKGKAEADKGKAEAEDADLQSPRATRTVLVPTPTKRRPDLLRHLLSAPPPLVVSGQVGRRISFSTPSPTAPRPAPTPSAVDEGETHQTHQETHQDLDEDADDDHERAPSPSQPLASPFGKCCRRSASPFSAIKPPPASLDTLRNINLMVNRMSTAAAKRAPPASKGRSSKSKPPPRREAAAAKRATAAAAAAASDAMASVTEPVTDAVESDAAAPDADTVLLASPATESAPAPLRVRPQSSACSFSLGGGRRSTSPSPAILSRAMSPFVPRSVSPHFVNFVSPHAGSVAKTDALLPRPPSGLGAVLGDAPSSSSAMPSQLPMHMFAPTTGSGTLRSFGGFGGTLLSCGGAGGAAAEPSDGTARAAARASAHSPAPTGEITMMAPLSSRSRRKLKAGTGIGGADAVDSIADLRFVPAQPPGTALWPIKRPASAMSTVSSAGSVAGLNITVKSQRTA